MNSIKLAESGSQPGSLTINSKLCMSDTGVRLAGKDYGEVGIVDANKPEKHSGESTGPHRQSCYLTHPVMIDETLLSRFRCKTNFK